MGQSLAYIIIYYAHLIYNCTLHFHWNGEMSGALNLGGVVCVGEVAFAPSRPKLLVKDEVGVDMETMFSTSGLILPSQIFSICREKLAVCVVSVAINKACLMW